MIPSDMLEVSWAAMPKVHSGIPNVIPFKNGSMISLFSYHQEQGSVEGFDIDDAYYNEPPPEWFRIGIRRGLRRRGSRETFAMTLLKEPWIFDQIYSKIGKDPEFWGNSATIYDNPHIDEEEKRAWVSSLSEAEKEVRLWGKPRFLSGRIWKQFDPAVHVKSNEQFFQDPEFREQFKELPKGFAIDPASGRPFAIIFFAVMPGNNFVIYDEWPDFKYKGSRETRTIDEYVEILNSKKKFQLGGDRIAWQFMDPKYGKQRGNTGRTLVDEFAECGYFLDVDFVHDVDPGHLAVDRLLAYDKTKPISSTNKPRLCILSNCENTIDAMLKYTFDTKTGRPTEDYKDFGDCVRYMVQGGAEYYDHEAQSKKHREHAAWLAHANKIRMLKR